MSLILIVDDDSDITDLLSVYLKGLGYSTAFANDGEQQFVRFLAKPIDFQILKTVIKELLGPTQNNQGELKSPR